MPYCPYGPIKKCKNTTPTADVWNTNLESGAFNVELPACIIVYGLFVYSHYPIQCAWKNHIIGLHHFSNSQKNKTVCLFYFFCALAAREERLFQGIYAILETWKSCENKSQKLLKTVRIEEEKIMEKSGNFVVLAC